MVYMIYIVEIPIKINDLGVPLFQETSIWKHDDKLSKKKDDNHQIFGVVIRFFRGTQQNVWIIGNRQTVPGWIWQMESVCLSQQPLSSHNTDSILYMHACWFQKYIYLQAKLCQHSPRDMT